MVNDPSSFLKTLNQLFHIEMNHQTSGSLFGSATTDDWVPARSDLDLFVLIPEEKIQLFSQKIKEWQSIPTNPIIDGFVFYSSNNVTMVREFNKFEKAVRLTEKFIPLIDLWNIKNHSKHLFGQDLKSYIREISQEELKDWAIRDIKSYWIPLINDARSRSNFSPETKISLSTLIWVASGVARMLMLASGTICSSKREALRWLAEKHPEIRELINLLREDYEKPDDMAITFTGSQAFTLGEFYLRLLREA